MRKRRFWIDLLLLLLLLAVAASATVVLMQPHETPSGPRTRGGRGAVQIPGPLRS